MYVTCPIRVPTVTPQQPLDDANIEGSTDLYCVVLVWSAATDR